MIESVTLFLVFLDLGIRQRNRSLRNDRVGSILELINVASDNVQIRILLKFRELLLEAVFPADIVCIHPRDKVICALRNA